MALFGRAAPQITNSVPAPPDLTVLCSKVTNPQAEAENPNDIREFCDAVNQTIDGPQRVIRIVVPKIQSLNEREAIYTLNLIDACVQSCGVLFHAEIGKFRFLNEMIKLLSPKYLGSTTPDRVKKRTIELLYGWSKGLPHEPKIKEAYEMLKQQGLITMDPTYVDCQYDVSPSKEVTKERSKNPIFDDEDKNKLLTKLLQSKNKEDLEAANRLIKSMVKEDEEKLQKQYKRTEELDTIHNNMRLMADMLNNYCKSSSQADVDLIKELKESLVKFRPRVFQLAAETDENDEAIGDILLASDELSSLLERYNATVGNVHYIPPDVPAVPDPSHTAAIGLLDIQSSDNLISDDLSQLGLFDSTKHPPKSETNPFAIFDTLASTSSSTSSAVFSNHQSLQFGKANISSSGNRDLLTYTTNPFSASMSANSTSENSTSAVLGPLVAPTLPNRPSQSTLPSTPDLSKNMSKKPGLTSSTPGFSSGAFGELDSLAKNWLSAAGDKSEAQKHAEKMQNINNGELGRSKSPDVPLIQEMNLPLVDTSPAETNTVPSIGSPARTLSLSKTRSHHGDFTHYAIKPSATLKAMSVMDDNEIGISITANFTQFSKPKEEDSEQSRGLTDIVVLTVSNASGKGYSKVGIQVACPKSMRTTLGSPSSELLSPKTPFAPPSVINQCLFIYNPNKVVPRLKLKISLSRDEDGAETESESINRVVDCSLDCLISESDIEFSDFN